MNKQKLHTNTKKLIVNSKNNGILNKNKYINYILLSVILIVTIFAYSNSFDNNFVKYDDDYYVTENKYIRDFSFNGIKEIIFSYVKDELPVTLISFAADYKIWKLNPKPYHIENLILHLINIVLVYILISYIFKNFNLALIVSLLFAIHPYRVESVAWIAERKDLLYSLFFLSSLICYAKYLQEKSKIFLYLFAVILSILSVLSKFSGVTLTFILILFDYYYKRKITFKTIIEKIPFIIIPVISTYIHFIYSPLSANQMQIHTIDYSFFERIFLGCYSLSFYILGIFFPFNLSVLHSYPLKFNDYLPVVYYISPIFIILIIIFSFLIIKKLSLLKREIIFGILFFLITISIVLHIVGFGGSVIVAERYTYIPYLGLFIIIGNILLWIIHSTDIKIRKLKPIILTISYIYLIVYMIFTYSRNFIWENTYTLFNNVIEKDTNIPLAYNNRGGAEIISKDYNKAITDFNCAIKLNPYYSEAYSNLAIAKFEQNDYNSAVEHLNKAIQLNKLYDKAYSNRGHIKTILNDYKGAMYDLNKAISINPYSYEAWYNKSILNYQQKNIKAAVDNLNKAIKINPYYAKAYVNRGNIKGELKDFNNAIIDYNKAIEVSPELISAYVNRGIAKYFAGNISEACFDWNIAANKGDRQAMGLLQQYCK